MEKELDLEITEEELIEQELEQQEVKRELEDFIQIIEIN